MSQGSAEIMFFVDPLPDEQRTDYISLTWAGPNDQRLVQTANASLSPNIKRFSPTCLILTTSFLQS